MTASHFKLRPYQEECLASIPDAGAYLICMATGLGKSYTFSQVPRRGRMLILSHRDELVHQPEKYFDCSFGVEQGAETSHGEEVVSASVQSLVRRLDKFKPDDFDVLVTDECVPAGTLVDGVPIEAVKIGDMVNAYNHRTCCIEKRRVKYLFKRRMPDVMVVINNSLICTPNHPIFEGIYRQYVNAEDLKIGDLLFAQWNDKPAVREVRSIQYFYPRKRGYVYNLEVEGLNNYFANGILVHNCHHAAAPTYRKIYDYFRARLHLGFTATPNRNDGVGLKTIYQDIIFERDLRWGIKNGYLSDIHCLRVNIGYDLSRVAMRLGDYAPEALDKAVNIEGANKAVAEAYRLYAEPPCLIFCTSVAHAEALAKLIPDAVAVKGGENRSDIVQAFSEGKIPCLTNCMVFTEGTDLPNIQTVIIARPTKNISLYTQMIGRATRLYPDKKYALLIDCVGAGDNINLCTAPSLLGLDINTVPPVQREKIKGNLFDLPDIVTELSDVPEAWIKNVKYFDLWAKGNQYNTHGVNYFKMPDGSLTVLDIYLPPEDNLGRIKYNGELKPTQKVFDEVFNLLCNDYMGQRKIWDLNLIKSWGGHAASDKQKDLIKKKIPNFDVDTLTKFEAGQILTRLFAPQSATPKQIYFLQRYGYDVEHITKQDAKKLIAKIKNGE